MLLLLSTLSFAAETETVVYGNVAGGLGFLLVNVGDFALGAEHRIGNHGVVAEGTIIHVHGNPTHATTYGGHVGYRYHLGQAFVGVMGGYEVGFAKVDIAEHGGPYHTYDLAHVSVMPHFGYRWLIGEHFAVTARVGAGYGGWELTARDADDAAEAGLLRDRLQFTPIKVDTELSFGVRF